MTHCVFVRNEPFRSLRVSPLYLHWKQVHLYETAVLQENTFCVAHFYKQLYERRTERMTKTSKENKSVEGLGGCWYWLTSLRS